MNTREAGILDGELVSLRPIAPSDAMRLTEILTHPDVAAWWGHWDRERVQREVISPSDDTVSFAIELDGRVIGLIQYAEQDEPDYRHASIDICLDPAWHGRGLGSDAVRTLARYLFEQRGHHRITIDPAAHNERAIWSYQRVGFRPVGVMRRYERGLDGRWHDGLLMDLLPEDLVPSAGRLREEDGPTKVSLAQSSIPAGGASVSERNKAVVRRLVAEVLNGGRLEAIDELYTPALASEAKAWIASFRESFPDVHMAITELIAEDDTVVGRFTCSGTHLGHWLGHAPTGRRFEAVDEVGIYRFRDGRIVETWGLEDNLGRLEQLELRC
jgi:aminoglycoside 6'-N-acetyltransferase